ncbi:3-ketoacyl-ACP reductase [Achromatium sp. WMS2]|nr:3-ketoacyl-ACP reductase [Achromatium sp. WMS2]
MSDTKKVALVTGGVGGIGTAICLRLSKEGFKVIACYYPPLASDAEIWVKEHNAAGNDIGIIAGDVTSEADSVRMIKEIESQYGLVEILVNCAGITKDRTFRKLAASDWEAVINTNLNSVFYVTRPVWGGMLDRGFGRIINISSVNGQRGQFGQTNYSAAKAGMHGFTMALAQEGAAKGVTVNTISPGYVETAMTGAMRPEVRDAIIAGVPMKRMGRPEEIAAVVAFLAAAENGYITGANIPVNGGLFMH